ncbi:MAG: dienelactone hydrolase family protein [Ignavibacteriaceae bacterium]|nr:dienelactone hydrolase family protein [Ignavibacteriaceae bacterium]MCK6615947.1 dienelactone hydrolase family protein [Ignavibacteriaceae bacterium]
MIHDIKDTLYVNRENGSITRAMIMVHGRGADAASILTLADYLSTGEETILAAPDATGNTWYPFPFIYPVEMNQPGLDSALELLKNLTESLMSGYGLSSRQICFLGFSQGACLAAEFTARNSARYGGVFILSGGLIGKEISRANYSSGFNGTPVFLGCSDTDFHIPKERVIESGKIFEELGADVKTVLYPNAPHSVFDDEINIINKVLTTGRF